MKSKVKKTIGIILFFLILAAGLAVIQPVYKGLSRALRSFESKMLTKLADQTGLGVSYSSLSPSILTGIRIKSIDIFDISTEKRILSVKNAVLKYRITPLLKGDFENGFDTLLISGVSFDFDPKSSPEAAKKLEALINNSGKDAAKSQATQSIREKNDREDVQIVKRITQTVKMIVGTIPKTVKIKDVDAKFKNSQLNAHGRIKNALLLRDADSSEINASASGFCISSIPGRKETVGFIFESQGKILPEFAGSSATLTISDYYKADYSLNKNDYLLSFNDSKFVIRSLMNIGTYSLYAGLDTNSGDADVNIKFHKFDPFTLLRIKKPAQMIKSLKGSTIDMKANLSYGLETNDLDWNVDTSVFLGPGIAPSGQTVSLDAMGNNSMIKVKSLNGSGSIADLDFNGSLIFNPLEPTGFLDVQKFILPNGKKISGQMFLDKTATGIMGFIPELFLEDKTFTAVQLDAYPKENSWDFLFSVDDYSHISYGEPGHIEISGSYNTGKKQYLQASVSIRSLFLDSVLEAAAIFVPEENAGGIMSMAKSLEPFLFTNELYVSTDFKSISFNSPYSVLANTTQERQLLLLSFDGNESSVQISNLDLIFNDYVLNAKLGADLNLPEQQAMFNSALTFNSIPYNIYGDFSNNWLSVTGDYGLELAVNFGKIITGRMQLVDLPVDLNGFMLSLSTELALIYGEQQGLDLSIEAFDVQELSNVTKIQPHIAFSGHVTQKGVALSSLNYTDSLSELSGSGGALWNFDEGIFKSLNAEIKMSSVLSKENISIQANFNNPMGVPVSGDVLMTDCFYTLTADIDSFPVGRFIPGQFADDTFSATITASGTYENPFVMADIPEFSMQLNGTPLIAKATATLEGRTVNINRGHVEWNGMFAENFNAEFDLEKFRGDAETLFKLGQNGSILSVPLNAKFSMEGDKKDSFVLDANAGKINSSLFNLDIPVKITAVHTQGRTDLLSNKELGFNGFILDDGTMKFAVTKDKPVNFTVEGKSTGPYIDLAVTDVYADLSRLSEIMKSPLFNIYKGILFGSLTISGSNTDPDLDGQFSIDDFDFNLPDYIPDRLSTRQFQVIFNQDEISVPATTFDIKDTYLELSAFIVLDRWMLDQMNIKILSGDTRGIPVDVKVPLMRFKGEIGIDTNVSISPDSVDVNGNIALKNSQISALTNSGATVDYSSLFAKPKASPVQSSSGGNKGASSSSDVRVSLQLLVGSKVQFVINPILRGLVAPNTPIQFNLDTSEETWNLKGDIVLRGGEVNYLNRNFYLKEGRINLNETQDSFDPNITVRAETRERDEDGNNVTITLSAIRQNVSKFNPVFTSSPAKSENEIMSLLGQLVTGDSDNVGNFLLAVGDYGVQVTVLRKIENALRDLLNFDIFSIRTMVLQNAVKQGLGMNKNPGNTPSVGNYFDNSTVYIGKYFGSSLYADALLQWTYDEAKATRDGSSQGLVFQPELGFELSSPFANIRWNFAPDLGALQNSWVPATSVTLSWRFTF